MVIAFGSNVGNRQDTIVRALKSLAKHVSDLAPSGLYESSPMYETDQEPFLNGVVVGRTDLKPAALLAELKDIERALGRIDRGRNGPREIDLDIVWMDGVTTSPAEHPELPHPRAHERRFVLQPLAELDENIELQGYGRVADLLAEPNVQAQYVQRVSDAPVLV